MRAKVKNDHVVEVQSSFRLILCESLYLLAPSDHTGYYCVGFCIHWADYGKPDGVKASGSEGKCALAEHYERKIPLNAQWSMFIDRICANYSPVNAYVLFDGSIKVESIDSCLRFLLLLYFLQFKPCSTALSQTTTLVDLWHLRLIKDQVLPFQPNWLCIRTCAESLGISRGLQCISYLKQVDLVIGYCPLNVPGIWERPLQLKE